jgi:hypothetical protein
VVRIAIAPVNYPFCAFNTPARPKCARAGESDQPNLRAKIEKRFD